MTAAARRYLGSNKEQGTGSASSAPVMVKDFMFSVWKTNTWLWEDSQTVCVRLIACPLGKLSKNYSDGPFFLFQEFKR